MALPCNPPNSLWYICRPGQGMVGCCAQFCLRRLELESILYWVSALLDEVHVVYAVDCQSALKVYKSPTPLWSIYWEQEPPHSNFSVRACHLFLRQQVGIIFHILTVSCIFYKLPCLQCKLLYMFANNIACLQWKLPQHCVFTNKKQGAIRLENKIDKT